VRPWLAPLQYAPPSQVWQDHPVTEIVETVSCACACAQHATCHRADDIATHLERSANAGVRSSTVRYRETDHPFMQRTPAD
jgi:uncharacterized protein involved in type VI secretion and phage assembly